MRSWGEMLPGMLFEICESLKSFKLIDWESERAAIDSEIKTEEMRNWADMLPEILFEICERVDAFKDLVAFGGVCSSWRHVAVIQNNGRPLLPLPWLMLAENKDDNHRDFFSVTEGKIYSYELPELRGKKCMETKGWIFTVSDCGEMALIHPLTHLQIPLPHQNTSECYYEYSMDPLIFVWRVVLSSSPDPKNKRDCVVMIIHGGMSHIGFCRPGDKKWTVIEYNVQRAHQSLEYYRGKFYAMSYSGDLWEYDVIGKSNDNDPVIVRKLEGDISPYLSCCQSYLVEYKSSLLLVTRNGVQSNIVSSKFWVFEIDVDHGGYTYVPSLGTNVIFVGHSATLSVDTMWYPELIPNSIYFTDDNFEVYLDEPEGGGTNMGVYNLDDESVQPHYNDKSLSLVCPPVWTFLTNR